MDPLPLGFTPRPQGLYCAEKEGVVAVGCHGDNVYYLLTKHMAGYLTKDENEDVLIYIYLLFTY